MFDQRVSRFPASLAKGNDSVLVTDDPDVFSTWVRQLAPVPGDVADRRQAGAERKSRKPLRHRSLEADPEQSPDEWSGLKLGGVGGIVFPDECPPVLALDLPFECGPAEDVEPVPQVSVTAIVYDQATLDEWSDTGFIPAFMNEVEAEEIPTVEEAVVDLNIRAPDPDGAIRHTKLRIRKPDGAVAVVYSYTQGRQSLPGHDRDGDIPCDAGVWWQTPLPGGGVWQHRFCCWVQTFVCNVVVVLFRNDDAVSELCGNCRECLLACW